MGDGGYHIEHRNGGSATIVATDPAELTRVAAELAEAGARGDLVVVETATGVVVVRWSLAAPPTAPSAGGPPVG